MTLGSDVSRLSTTAASAAAQGLSIVVPLYNEAAGLAVLHERLAGLARTLKARYGLASEVVYVDDGSADNTLAIARTLPADALDVQVVSLSRNFGKEAALMAGLDHARRGAICSWTATASIRRAWSKSWSRTGSMTATTSSIRRRRIATMNRSCAARRCTASTR
jgi:hypothetical protein